MSGSWRPYIAYEEAGSAYIIDNTGGRGDCAFKALIRGLSNPEVLDGINPQPTNERFNRLIRDIAGALNVENNLQTVKTKMLELGQTRAGKKELEIKLAFIFRTLAVDLAREDKGNLNRTKDPLLSSAFTEYVNSACGIRVAGQRDDIIRQHRFIENKFRKLFADIFDALDPLHFEAYKTLRIKRKRNKQENEYVKRFEAYISNQINHLRDTKLFPWWEAVGYGKFLDQMGKQGKWAGDLELSQIVRFLDVNLSVLTRDRGKHDIHWSNGEIPMVNGDGQQQFSAETIKQLVDRDIINRPEPDETSFRLMALTHEQVKVRLSRVPHYDQVHSLIEVYPNEDLIGVYVPNWPTACIEELARRNVIARKQDHYEFIVGASTAAARVNEVEEKDLVLQAHEAYGKEKPRILLSNPSGTHWDNTEKLVEPAPIARKDKAKKQPSFFKSEAYTKTINMLAKREISFAATEWNKWMAQAQKDDHCFNEIVERMEERGISNYKPKGYVTYSLDDPEKGKIDLHVTRATQIALDAELAKKLQQEEYAAVAPRKRR